MHSYPQVVHTVQKWNLVALRLGVKDGSGNMCALCQRVRPSCVVISVTWL